MRDYGTIIRKAFYDVIKNEVTIDSGVVPIIDEKVEGNSGSAVVIRITTQDMQQQNTKHHFRATCRVLVEVTQYTKTAITKLKIDNVCNQILTLLYPDPKTIALTVPSPYQLPVSYLEGTDTSPFMKVEAGLAITKTLIFNNIINQS